MSCRRSAASSSAHPSSENSPDSSSHFQSLIMNKYEIQPFFFPTTVAFVDDSADFLANLSLQLDPRLAFRLFKSPSAAMRALDRSETVPHPVQSFFSFCK